MARDFADLLFIQVGGVLGQVPIDFGKGARPVSSAERVEELRDGRFERLRRVDLRRLDFGCRVAALADVGLQILGAVLRLAKFDVAD